VIRLKLKYIFIFACILAVSSANNFAYSQNDAYSFFIAGHVYGSPGVENLGFHPPFKAKFDYIQSHPEIEFGVLLGDVVGWGSHEKWDMFDAEIDTLGLPVYIAVGNHDMYNGYIYIGRYGATYHSFIHNNDLFVILDPNIDNWNISGGQLAFLQTTIYNNYKTVDNVFIMMHQVLWWEKEGHYDYIIPNSEEARADSINYWTELEPLFRTIPNQVVICAGDIGAKHDATNIMYDSYENITLICTGMGNGYDDNFVVININENKDISYDLICLDSADLDCLGTLESQIVSSELPESYKEIEVFPNPANEALNILLHQSIPTTIEIFTTEGILVYKLVDVTYEKVAIDLSNFSKGFYFVRIKNRDKIKSFKIVVN